MVLKIFNSFDYEDRKCDEFFVYAREKMVKVDKNETLIENAFYDVMVDLVTIIYAIINQCKGKNGYSRNFKVPMIFGIISTKKSQIQKMRRLCIFPACILP